MANKPKGGSAAAKSNPAAATGRLDARGRRTAEEMFGPGGADRMEATYVRREQEVDKSWADLSGGYVTNGMYSRNVLPTSVRELCAVAALTALGHQAELRAHIGIALNSNPPRQVREVILQMSVYGGFPVAFEGLRIYDEVMARRKDKVGKAGKGKKAKGGKDR